MAGKGNGVSGVMSRIVQNIGLGQSRNKQDKHAEYGGGDRRRIARRSLTDGESMGGVHCAHLSFWFRYPQFWHCRTSREGTIQISFMQTYNRGSTKIKRIGRVYIVKEDDRSRKTQRSGSGSGVLHLSAGSRLIDSSGVNE